MGLTTTASDDRKTVKIEISGRFDHNLQRQFRSVCEALEAPGPETQVVVDLSETEYIDSSALGMLLVLRNQVGGAKANIELRNPSEEIRTVFSIANIDNLFTVR